MLLGNCPKAPEPTIKNIYIYIYRVALDIYHIYIDYIYFVYIPGINVIVELYIYRLKHGYVAAIRYKKCMEAYRWVFATGRLQL